MGNVNLRIDCSRLKLSAVDDLAKRLRMYLSNVIVAGEDLIYASGNISTHDYNNVWKIIDWYDVTVS